MSMSYYFLFELAFIFTAYFKTISSFNDKSDSCANCWSLHFILNAIELDIFLLSKFQRHVLFFQHLYGEIHTVKLISLSLSLSY